MKKTELLWNRYQLAVESYLKYMDLIIKFNLFYYGITGAILSYYFANEGNGKTIELSLIVPILFSIGVVALTAFGNGALRFSAEEIKYLYTQLDLNYYVRIEALIYLVRATGIFALITGITLAYILVSFDI